MHKKKIQALMVAGLLSVGVIGGTLAWFTSQDSLTNVFNTGSVTDPEDGLAAGIELNENFIHPGENGVIDSTPGQDGIWGTEDDAINSNDEVAIGKGSDNQKIVEMEKPVTPGTTLTKEVEVENTTDYSQIVAARVNKYFYILDKDNKKQKVTHWKEDTTGEIIYDLTPTETGWTALDLSKIVLAKDLYGTGAPEGWTIQTSATTDTSAQESTNWYYYSSILAPNAVTKDILKSVTLDGNSEDQYRNLKFDVQVEAYSIQATNKAIYDVSNKATSEDWWKNVPQSITNLDLYGKEVTE